MQSTPSSSLPQPAPEPEIAHLPPGAPDDRDVPGWRLWMAPAGIALGLGLGLLGTVVVEVVAAVAGSSLAHLSPATTIAADIVFDLGFVCGALYLTSIRGGVRLAEFGFRRVSPRLAIAAFVIAVISYFGVTTVYSSLLHLHGKDKLPSELGATHSTAALIAASIFVCVVAPIAEEFFFRGFLFGVLRRLPVRIGGRNLGTWVAAVIVAVLFGAAHLGSAALQYLPPLAFLGFVLCLMRWRTGSLYPGIALHSANNALALGVNQLSWNAAEIVGLVLATWLVVAAITAPLGARSEAVVRRPERKRTITIARRDG